MRISCPNCGAQYEVDDALIPETGRDVQCSNCGKGWFQNKPVHEAVEGAAPSTSEIEPDHDFGEPEREPEYEPPVAEDRVDENSPAEAAVEESDAEVEAHGAQAPGDTEPYEEVASSISDDSEDFPLEEETGETHEPEPEGLEEIEPVEVSPEITEPDEPSVDEDKPAPDRAPRNTDENVLAVLREEAEREISARRAEQSTGLETQPDLGLEETSERRGTGPGETAQAAAISASTRRDLLPDIDEINSSLRSDADREAETDAAHEGYVVQESRRGFRLGFGLMVLLAAALVGLYVASGWIAGNVPGLEPYIIAYVDWANGVRDWFDGVLEAGVAGLTE